MIYIGLDPRFDMEHLGFLPGFLSEDDPHPAREQLDANYQHGGGYRPQPGWKMNPETLRITYPGDPPLAPIAFTKLREELILFYPLELVAIIQPDGSFVVARMN